MKNGNSTKQKDPTLPIHCKLINSILCHTCFCSKQLKKELAASQIHPDFAYKFKKKHDKSTQECIAASSNRLRPNWECSYLYNMSRSVYMWKRMPSVSVKSHCHGHCQETDASLSGLLITNPPQAISFVLFAKSSTVTETNRCKPSRTHQHCNVVFNAAILKSISANQQCTESPPIAHETQPPCHTVPLLFCIVFGLC